jgi:5-formyltetrahydrofolate cyclo-ligase
LTTAEKPEHAMNRATTIRQQIWEKLRPVAKPDSRFHLNFAEVIPDFEGSDRAIDRLVAEPAYRAGRYAFITPDNGLVDLRRRMLEDGKTLVVSTYGIYRGFVLLEPAAIAPGHYRFASWLDGLEYFGRPIGLRELAARGRFDFMVTGASAVSLNGVRFGKGHGFFDMEWGMFTDVGVADELTPVTAVVHDVQVVDDMLEPGETDILVDAIATPTRHLRVDRGVRPHGIRWDLLDAAQLAATPPLQELKAMQDADHSNTGQSGRPTNECAGPL